VPGTRPRRGAGRGARRRLSLLALLAAGLLAGCATMPDSGPVSQVPDTGGNDAQGAQNAQVRVYPVPPTAGEEPQQLLYDFLDALASDESDYGTAREYLTSGAADHWQYGRSIAVLDSTPRLSVSSSGGHEHIELTGHEVATVDGQSAYEPIAGGRSFRVGFDFVKDAKAGGQWRIDALPPGVILQQIDFQRIYQSVNLYFPTRDTGVGGSPSRPVMVPDPVFLRGRIDPVTTAARLLLQGPTQWFQPITTSSFPAGARLLDRQLSPDDNGALVAHLSGVPGLARNAAECREMAAQLLLTLQDASSGAVKQVGLASGATGGRLCSSDTQSVADMAPSRLAGDTSGEYYVGTDGKVLRTFAQSDKAVTAGVAQIPSSVDGGLGAIAVSRAAEGSGAQRFALVTKGRHELYVPSGYGPDALGRPWLSTVGGSLSTPSWDGTGTLWVANANGNGNASANSASGPVVAMVNGRTLPVDLTGLPAGGRVTGLRVSPDGTRIALIVQLPKASGSDVSSELLLGRVERGGRAAAPSYTIDGLRAVAPDLVDVSSVSWADYDSLIVLGKPEGGAKELQYVDTDGSVAGSSAQVPMVEGMTTVSASLDQDQPLLADSGPDGRVVYRLGQSTSWRALTPGGTAPTYPG